MRQLIVTGLGLVILLGSSSLVAAQALSDKETSPEILKEISGEISEEISAGNQSEKQTYLSHKLIISTKGDESEVETLLQQVDALIAAEDHVAAVKLLQEVIRLEPDNALAHGLLGAAMLSHELSAYDSEEQYRLNEIEAVLQESIRLDPNLAAPRQTMISILYFQGDFEGLEQQTRELIRINPEKEENYKFLAVILSGNSPDFSVTRLREAIAQYGPRESFYLEIATVYARVDQDAEQAAVLREALAHHPDSAEIYSRLGYLLTTQARYTEAIPLFEAEVRLDPNEPYPYRNLGDALQNAGHLAEAEAIYREGLANNPLNDFSYRVLSHFLNEQGRFQEAETIYRQATQLPEPTFRAFIDLKEFLIEQGRPEEAEALSDIADCVRRRQQQQRYRQGERPIITCGTAS